MTFFTDNNILPAYKMAAKSRNKKLELYLFDQNREERLIRMKNSLIDRNYHHGEYKKIILYDNKRRIIFSPTLKDHILHHLIYAGIYDILDSKMVQSSFACRKNYGSHKGILYLRKLIKSQNKKLSEGEKLYYLKIDFSKYFFSINHEKLRDKIKKYVNDEDILYAVDVVLNSYHTGKDYDQLLNSYDFYINEKNKGLPIGGILSQLFANFYLNDLDQYLKHKLKVKFVRYMDDVLILGTKEKLKEVSIKIQDFVRKENLILNPRKISFNLVEDGIKFVGYKIKDNNIYVGKRIRLSYLKFIDSFGEINIDSLGEDRERVKGGYFSREGCFKITTFGNSYTAKVKHRIPSWC